MENKYPLIKKMKKCEEIFWINENVDNKLVDEITKGDIEDAKERLRRFSSYIKKAFPKTLNKDGIIESPLIEIPLMKDKLMEYTNFDLHGRMFLKCDNLLPISGSIKARGGIYEVLFLAEKIAIENNMLKYEDDYSILYEDRFKKLFSNYSIGVGSTGNLGLSIGIMSAKLGFSVTVHMSQDARQWKKDLLREKGVNVVEYEGDFKMAVDAGRKLSKETKNSHFVDDENSKTLFLGYAVAAERLKSQLEDMNIFIDDDHPLMVYLPCGVGGGPGGVTYGLKQIYGKNVHCIFAEPTEAPSMLLGIMTGLHDEISVQDIGLSGKTLADGLAVGRPSKLVGKIVQNLIDGIYTINDDRLYTLERMLYLSEKMFIEPSAAASIPGFYLTQKNEEIMKRIPKMENAIHIAWATGGSMVPEDERRKYLGI